MNDSEKDTLRTETREERRARERARERQRETQRKREFLPIVTTMAISSTKSSTSHQSLIYSSRQRYRHKIIQRDTAVLYVETSTCRQAYSEKDRL